MKHGTLLALAMLAAAPTALADGLETEFLTPPDASRPGVYWTIQDGNQDRDEMIADMNSLNDVGFGSILFMEVDLGYAKGPVPFMSTQWVDNIANAFVHAGTLGMEVIIMTGPGWTGSGGPWTPIEDSMKHLVGSSVQVSGPGTLNQVLPVAPPHPANPYAGMNGTIAAQRNAWFEDVAVIAFPTPSAGTATIGTANSQEVNAKILKGLLPYSSSGEARNLPFVMPLASYTEPGADKVLDDSQVVDLTSLLQPDGSINWTIPAGNWTVMRFVARSTGQTSRPAPAAGYGLENDKFDGSTFRAHWNNFQKPLLDKIVAQGGPLQPGRGLTTIHLDSWEMSSQNWTGTFRTEFQTRRGYDPQPFYPAWMGQVVGSREETERFLWDMRKTSQELTLEEYAGEIKAVAHENGLLYSNQPYDMNPNGDMDLVSVADIPSCEFWNDTFNTQYGVIEAVSTARTMGPQLVRAEAYTSGTNSFAKNPANMKNQTDWAFAIGINGFVFHGSAHQPLGDIAKPGMTFGQHGINLSRHNTLWDYLPGYNSYLARCSHTLRQGEAVGDILYLAPEAAPHVFEAPVDATEGVSSMRDKRGYSFDAVTPRILSMRATVDGDRIAFPDGSKYRVLVLPDVATMTPETLTKIDQLVQAGATIIGKPPVKSPSLVNYPACDTSVSTLATAMWGGATAPGSVTPVSRGSGTIYWGGNLEPGAALYPSYAATASVLAGLGLAEDFTSPSGKLRYQHRVTTDRDIYFVSNRTGETLDTEGVFRIDGLAPKLWDPVSGETRALEEYSSSGGVTTVPLTFKPAQSYFIVFPHSSSGSTPPTSPEDNFPAFSLASQLGGSWDVAFDPALGGPASVTFASLVDWTQRPEPGIHYYSGTATYTKSFDLLGYDPADGYDFFLDVGAFNGICEVRLNGQDIGSAWTAPWRVDITAALQATGNQLEIEVVNNWVNRLIGDQQPADKDVRSLSWLSGLLGGGSYGAGRYTFATTSPWAASSPLQSAGLLGPVQVLTSGPDGFPPASTSLVPADDATTVFLPAKLQVAFSEPVARGNGNITIKNLSASTQVVIDVTDTTQVAVAGNGLSITPTGGFLPDTNYAVQITTGAITDATGTAYAGITDDTTWNFNSGSSTAATLYLEDFEELQLSDPGVIDGGASGIFTGSTWPTAPEFVLTGAANLLKPAVSSTWLSPVPAALGTTFATLHSGISATITLTENFADNATYELSFTHFSRDDTGVVSPDAITAKILAADGTVLVSTEFPAVPTTDTYETRTLSWTTSGGSEVGQAIRIRFDDANEGTANQQAAIDNILLVASSGSGNDFNSYISDPSFGLDPAEQGFALDPDGDGTFNGLEAWFGTHPGEFTAGLADLTTDGPVTTFTHPQNATPPSDLTGFYQWSPNLTDWYTSGNGPGGGVTVTFSFSTSATTTTVTATVSGAPDRVFLRSGVTQN